eukprot:14162-Heterococcus_DN1.PRE.2
MDARSSANLHAEIAKAARKSVTDAMLAQGFKVRSAPIDFKKWYDVLPTACVAYMAAPYVYDPRMWTLEKPSLLDQFNPVETMYLRAASRYEATRFIAHAVSYKCCACYCAHVA